MAINWYLSQPGDSSIVSQHPANERAFRAAVHDAFAVEHDADTTGRHIIPSGDVATRDALTWPDTGSLYVSNENIGVASALQLHFRTGSTWYQFGEFISGTILVFRQASAPTGWTQTADNDRLMRIVAGAGGGYGGGWGITGLSVETADHTHNVVGNSSTESATHYHDVIGNTGGPSANILVESGADTAVPHPAHTHAIAISSGTQSALHFHSVSFASSGISATHTHNGDGSWRPAYVDVIAATKD